MNIVAQLEHRASSSRRQHEGESSFALCDRLSRTRDNSQRQLPTDRDYAVPTREYQTDQSSLKPPRLLLALSSRKSKRNYKKHPPDFAALTRSLHIRTPEQLTDRDLKAFCRSQHEHGECYARTEDPHFSTFHSAAGA
jgi:hypothetical protein